MNSKDTLETLEERANVTLLRLFNKMLLARKYPRDYGTGELLYLTEIEVIDRVSQNDHATMTLLAEQIGVTKATISPLVNKLVEKDYLYKTTAPDHKNVKLLSLTAKGKTAVCGVRRYKKRHHSYLKDVSKAEFMAHIKLLLRMEAYSDGLD